MIGIPHPVISHARGCPQGYDSGSGAAPQRDAPDTAAGESHPVGATADPDAAGGRVRRKAGPVTEVTGPAS